MAYDSFPVFAAETLRWYPMGMTASGGGTFTGPGQVAEFSGGGWWCAELSGLDQADGPDIRRMQALLGRAAFGVGLFVVRMIVDPLRALPESVPFDDDAPFDDETEFEGGAVTASLVEAAALRATSLVIQSDVELLGGEAFTIVHAAHGPRVYLLTAVVPVEGEANRYSVRILPPLREAVAAEVACDFDRPRCVMRLDDPSGSAWPTIQPGWQSKTSLRFVEAFDRLETA